MQKIPSLQTVIKDLLQTRRADTICTALVFLLFIYFAALVLHEIPYTSFHFDSALHAMAAKTIAFDIGKPVTPYTFELLSTQSTGPTLILWGAAWFKLFGNAINSPAIAAGALNLLLLGIFLRNIRSFFSAWHYLFLTTGMLFIFIIKDLSWWIFFVGDIPAFLIFLIASTIAAKQNPFESKQLFYFTILVTLALRARLTILPAVAGCCLYLLVKAIYLLKNRSLSFSSLLKNVAISIITAGALASIYELIEYSFFFLSKDIYYSDFITSRKYLYSTNSTAGIGSMLTSPNPLHSIISNITSNYHLLSDSLQHNLGITFPLPIIAAITGLAAYFSLTGNDKANRWLTILLLGTAMTSIWFFCITRIVFERYTLQIELLLAFLALTASMRIGGIYGVIVLVFAINFFAPDSLRDKFHTTLLFETRGDQKTQMSQRYNRDIQKTADFIQSHELPSPVAKCGWMTAAWSVDYVLQGTGHMQDCYLIIRESLKLDNQTGHYKWQHPVSFTWIMDKTNWKFSKINAMAKKEKWKLFDACRTNTLYENENFKIMDCQFEALEQAIPTDSPSIFVDDTHYFFR